MNNTIKARPAKKEIRNVETDLQHRYRCKHEYTSRKSVETIVGHKLLNIQ